jgi:hypothetical protein
MKLLLHSNAPWAPTGYGQQCATFAPMLAQHYDLAISSFYGLEGAPLKWQGIPVLPGLGGEYGNVSLPRHAMEIFDGDRRGGLVLTLMDVWVLSAATCAKMNMACWVPVDHQPAPPAVVEFFMESGAVPIAMSRFGWNMLGRLDPLYVPHGIDTDAYQPQDRTAVREKYGFPADAFLVGMVAANKGRPSRKGFQEAFEAFARFRRNARQRLSVLAHDARPVAGAGRRHPGPARSVEHSGRPCPDHRPVPRAVQPVPAHRDGADLQRYGRAVEPGSRRRVRHPRSRGAGVRGADDRH